MDMQAKFENISWGKADKLAPLVLLLLILALCWKLASIFWWVVAPPQVINPESVTLGSQQQLVPNISGFALFYEAGSAAKADDQMQMQLQGVVLGYPNRYSSAVIKVNEVADRYAVGQNIEGSSYQLAEVYWDHIVLKQSNGSVRELKFKGLENLNQPMIPTQTANSAHSPTASENTPSVNSEQNALGQAIQKMNEDRDAYMKNMGVNTAGGQGYEVTEQTPSALKSKLGLRSGDRILSLNGQTVGQGQSDVQLLEQAKKEGKVRIEIKRGDQVMTIQQSL
ncbi:general secretion pathway protein [Acinetobacter silvestris]|uniref:General secretion pathway protein n=2 Tax=Acinetobacter silvestris TaxID=1977882 RepID=A0A1Y3CP97_9GAMM|nr:type II secretion system protein N [Acinetobacter silvestris]OTG67693.1 general secretion pathway protein [Acinetobacter silvestris]